LLSVSIGVVGTGRAGIPAISAAPRRIILDKYILPFDTPAFNIGAAGMLEGVDNTGIVAIYSSPDNEPLQVLETCRG